MLKSPNCDPWLRSQLHRNLGQLAAAKNSLTEARRHFAEDVSTSQSACLCTTSGLKRVQLNMFSQFVTWMVPSLLDLPTVIAVSIVPVRMVVVVVSVSVCKNSIKTHEAFSAFVSWSLNGVNKCSMEL